MGRKGNWLSTVKKALSPESKEKKDQKPSGSKKKRFGKQKLQTLDSHSHLETDKAPPLPPPEEIILTHVENENNHDHVEDATALDVEESVPPVQIATVEVQATTIVQFDSEAKDEMAAIKIQTAFQGYLAGEDDGFIQSRYGSYED